MAEHSVCVYPRSSDKRHKIAIIEGPNQPTHGNRSKSVYGDLGSLEQLQALCREEGGRFRIEIIDFVSNVEGELLQFIHRTAPDTGALGTHAATTATPTLAQVLDDGTARVGDAVPEKGID